MKQGGEVRSRNEIQEEVQELRGRLREIKERKGDGNLYPVEDAMEKAHITVTLAALWDEWQGAEWEWGK